MEDVWNKYWVYFLVFVWPVLSCLLNLVLRKKTAEEWVAFGEKNPRLAGIIRLLRAVGLDPVKGFQALKEIIGVQAKANVEKLPEPVKTVEKLLEAQQDKEKPQ
jgi:hypothetical protein